MNDTPDIDQVSGWHQRMVRRFQRCRWSKTRKRIDALSVGESATFPLTERYNATTSVQRLQDAYERAKQFKTRTVAAGLRVERVAPNENKMSDGGRSRASVGVEVWKSCQKWSVQRSAVRSIAWLGLWGQRSYVLSNLRLRIAARSFDNVS
jgi:hypothetical protein